MSGIRVINTLDEYSCGLEEITGLHSPGDRRGGVLRAVMKLDDGFNVMIEVHGRDAVHHLDRYLGILLELLVLEHTK